MKTRTLALGTLLPFLLAWQLEAQVSETNRFTSLNQPIPDGNASGLSQARTVTSAIGSLTSVRVKLHINGQFNGDLYAYLRHIQGGVTNRCILLNRPGRTLANSYGYADAGLDVTFNDSAANDVHAYGAVTNVPAGSPLTGVWQPDGRNVDPGVVLDTSARSTTLGAFNGTPAGGEWTLFLADMDSGASSTLVSWELEFTGVATPTLAWAPPADIVYGTALSGAQLNAAATFDGSSVPGNYTYTPAAGTVLNAGNSQTLSVTFTPADLNTYLPVSMNVPINVLQAPLNLTANNRSKTYGQTVTFAGTEFNASGLVNGDTVTSVTLTSAGAAATANVGTPGPNYPIVASAAVGTGLGNYSITYHDGTLTVNAAALDITANNRSKTYGQTVTFAGTEFNASGLVNGDTVTSVTLTSAGAAATATVSTPGPNYPIVASAAVGTGLGNYNITYHDGTLNVTPAVLTVTADNKSRLYGEANPSLTATITGFVNGQNLASSGVTGEPSLSTTAVPASSVAGSPYPITAGLGTLQAGNYTFAFVDGLLTILQASTAGVVTSSANPSLPGQGVTFSFTVSAVAPGAGTPTGSATFRFDGAAGTSVPLSGGTATLLTSTLPVGTHTLVVEYAGDGNFLGTTSTLVPLQLVNTPPVAATDTLERWPTNGVKVSIATLLSNDSDADGDTVSFAAFSAASSQGGVITRAGDWLFYAPSAGFTGADTFTYTVSDGRGAPVSGLVNVAIKVDLLPSPNLAITDLGNGSYRIRFDGIADRTYRIEYTDSLSPALWNPLGSATADGSGLFEYVDTPPGGTPARFYRSVWP